MRGSSTILWIVRAGDSTWQRQHRVQGRADLPLSPEGRTALLADLIQFGGHPNGWDDRSGEAGSIAPRIESRKASLAAVHHAEDEAARETAQMVAQAFGGRVRQGADLAEPDMGLLSGLTLDQFEERFPTRHRQWQDEPLALIPPEGEALEMARRRVLQKVVDLGRRHRGEEFGVVLHPIALAIVRAALALRPGRDLWRMLEGRPRVERYLLPADLEARLLE